MRTVLVAVALLAFAFPVRAQYVFDVKTRFSDKHELQVAKRGLLSAIEESPWAAEADLGEDYSLWLDRVDRVHRGDSVVVSASVSLRTPAMFRSGRLIGTRRVWLSYHWDDMTEHAALSAEATSFSNSRDDYGEIVRGASALLGHAVSAAAFSFPGTELLAANLSSSAIGALADGLGRVFRREPSSVEVLESLLLGNQCLEAARDIIAQGG